MTVTNPRESGTGLEVRRALGRGDGKLSDLKYRAIESFRLLNSKSGPINPDGRWYLETNRVTRKAWDGYHRRVNLETGSSLGGGWRVWMDSPGGGVQYPILVRSLTTSDDGAVEWTDYLEIKTAPEPGHVPTLPRREAFRAAEQFMTAYATEMARSVDALDRNGWGPDDDDE